MHIWFDFRDKDPYRWLHWVHTFYVGIHNHPEDFLSLYSAIWTKVQQEDLESNHDNKQKMQLLTWCMPHFDQFLEC